MNLKEHYQNLRPKTNPKADFKKCLSAATGKSVRTVEYWLNEDTKPKEDWVRRKAAQAASNFLKKEITEQELFNY